MFRAIREVQPRWVVAENVAGIINMELDEVLADLEGAGYETQTFIIPACAIGAPHRRDRIWIIGNDDLHWGEQKRKIPKKQKTKSAGVGSVYEPNVKGSDIIPYKVVADTNREHGQESLVGYKLRQTRGEGTSGRDIYEPNWEENWLETATRLCRMDDGISRRMDRLRALGNAIVPQVACVIFDAIKQIGGQNADRT